MNQSTRPHAAEVILAELLAAQSPLDFPYLASRCAREACDHGPVTASGTVLLLMHAGLIQPIIQPHSGFYEMSPEGRELLRMRPPYDCRRAIIDQLAANGPCTLNELRHACRQQALDYSEVEFALTLARMVREDCTVADVTEAGDSESSYDLPD